MAGPLSGLSGQTSAPLSTPYQPGQNASATARAQENQTPQTNRVQPQNAAAADTQNSQANRRNDKDDQKSVVSLSADERGQTRRGSLVDITV